MKIDEVKQEGQIYTINPNSEKPASYLEGDSNIFSELVKDWVEEGGVITVVDPTPIPSTEDLRQERMMTGVEFDGVMCSAFKEDQWGLSSIKDFVLGGAEIQFEFKNDNVLTLNPENISAFEATWIPFRQTCLKVNFTG